MLYNLLSLLSIIGFIGVFAGDQEITLLIATKTRPYSADDCFNNAGSLYDGDTIYLEDDYDTVWFCAVFVGVENGDDLCIRVEGDNVDEFGQEDLPVIGKYSSTDEIVRIFGVAAHSLMDSSYITVRAVLTPAYGNEIVESASYYINDGEESTQGRYGEVVSIVAMWNSPTTWQDCDESNSNNYGELILSGETITFTAQNDIIYFCAIFDDVLNEDELCLYVEDDEKTNAGTSEGKVYGTYSEPVYRAIGIAVDQFYDVDCDFVNVIGELKDSYGDIVDAEMATFDLEYEFAQYRRRLRRAHSMKLKL